MKSPVLGSKIDKYPSIQLLILLFHNYLWFYSCDSLGVVSWMILIHNFFAPSISYSCNGPADLLTIRFRLNRRIYPVILNSFLYVNLLIMLVIKWIRLSSMIAMVTITLSLIFNVPLVCLWFEQLSVVLASLLHYLANLVPHTKTLSAFLSQHLLCQDHTDFI